jgi:hypothetical protein
MTKKQGRGSKKARQTEYESQPWKAETGGRSVKGPGRDFCEACRGSRDLAMSSQQPDGDFLRSSAIRLPGMRRSETSASNRSCCKVIRASSQLPAVVQWKAGGVRIRASSLHVAASSSTARRAALRQSSFKLVLALLHSIGIREAS